MIKGFVCGVFDLFHAGHVLMLKECRANCDYLVLALNVSSNLNCDKNKPIYSLDERLEIIKSIRYVDEVITYSTENELKDIIILGKYDIRFLGDDYKSKPITASRSTEKIYFCNRDHGLSSSKVRERILKASKIYAEE